MDIFITLSFLTFLGVLITFLIFKVIKKQTKILNKLVFITYTLFILVTSFVDNNLFEFINSVLILQIIYISVLLIILIIKNNSKVLNWLRAILILTVLYILNYMILNIHLSGLAGSLLEGIIFPILIIYSLTFILLLKKNHHANMLIKIILSYYMIFIIAFSLSPPTEIVTILISLVTSILIGAIPALLLFIIYKKNNKLKDEKKDKGDFS